MSSVPRASVLMLAYRQRDTVEAAARSILAQACEEPLELRLSDDASDDGTFESMERVVATTPCRHEVRVLRNPRNLGIGAHLNYLAGLARGGLLVIAAGDDISLPHRTSTLLAAWDASAQRVDLLASPLVDMAQDGSLHGMVEVDDLAQWKDANDWARRRPKVIGAAQAWTRRLHEHFGPFDPRVVFEDQIAAFRAICCGGAITLKEPLVHYRRGGTSMNGASDREARQQRMRQQNVRHLAEAEQLLKDARTIGAPAAVNEVLAEEEARQRYLAALLDAPGLAAQLRIMGSAPGVPWEWRWRKFWSVAC